MLELWFLFCLIWSLGAGVDEEKMDNFILEMEGRFPSKSSQMDERYLELG
jgi:dynein heavy chain